MIKEILTILITKILSPAVIDLAKSWGWEVDVAETLHITQLDIESVPPNADVWIISSRNSWSMVKKFIHQAPNDIYCIGQWVLNELVKVKSKSKTTIFENMADLATELAQQKFQQVVYFCGDYHRVELDQATEGKPIEVIKVITHESRPVFPVLNREYDVVFVFSPRSVDSLLKNNVFSAQTVFAGIGQTTVSYLRAQGISNTFCSSYPDSQVLLNEFREQAISN